MLRISDLVRVPPMEEGVARRYSEGCFATWGSRAAGSRRHRDGQRPAPRRPSSWSGSTWTRASWRSRRASRKGRCDTSRAPDPRD